MVKLDDSLPDLAEPSLWVCMNRNLIVIEAQQKELKNAI